MAARKNNPASAVKRRTPLFTPLFDGRTRPTEGHERVVTMSQLVLLERLFPELEPHRGWILTKHAETVFTGKGQEKLDEYGNPIRRWRYSVFVRHRGRIHEVQMDKESEQQMLRDAEVAWQSEQVEVNRWRADRERSRRRKPSTNAATNSQ